MARHFASTITDADATLDDLRARMRAADHQVAVFTDPNLRAQIDPEVPEYVGPPRPRVRRGLQGRMMT